MPKRPEDPRSYNERVYPIVKLLTQLGHPVQMPDHLLADDARYVHWMDAVVTQLEADTGAAGGVEPPPNLMEQHFKLQCVVGENIRRLAELLNEDITDTDDVGQELDFIVDHFIDLVQRIVERNEELANQLEDCNTGMARVRSLDKPHNPDNPAHAQVVDRGDPAPVTGRASGRPASDEDREPIREAPVDPQSLERSYPTQPATRSVAAGLTKQVGRRPMSGPWR